MLFSYIFKVSVMECNIALHSITVSEWLELKKFDPETKQECG